MAHRYPLKVRVTNQMVTYDHENDKFYYRTDITPSTYVKCGYMAYDMSGRNIGIVFFSDDKRTKRYGNSEFLFLAPLRKELGVWRTIFINGDYFWFSRLEKILETQSEYVFTADGR
ncbi:MAG: hypothetical protein J1G05_05215 [Clostridiales bacterium]|nr:hypothetical protein [Clostridiales bacterium]